MSFLILFIISFCGIFNKFLGYFITVQPRREECFHEYVKNGDKINMMYEVAEGGFLDIDVRIINARNALVYDKQRETSGKVSLIKLIIWSYRNLASIPLLREKSFFLSWKESQNSKFVNLDISRRFWLIPNSKLFLESVDHELSLETLFCANCENGLSNRQKFSLFFSIQILGYVYLWH